MISASKRSFFLRYWLRMLVAGIAWIGLFWALAVVVALI